MSASRDAVGSDSTLKNRASNDPTYQIVAGKCVPDVIFGLPNLPKYSYVYNYTNTPSCAPGEDCDIEYPEYNITTYCLKENDT